MRDAVRAVGDGRGADNDASGAAAPPAPGRRRLEIVHESLLTKWPRLVRWRAQDEEGAVLRDQLRQAAQLWRQHERAEDFLWTGTAFREFQLWRERYPGGLTALEEAFAVAMTAHDLRRRRRRRLAVAVLVTVLATGLVVVATLRQQAVAQAQRAEGETRRAEAELRRAEASKVLALGQLELEGNPTAALAYAIRSLELADTYASRLFALRALAAGPLAFLHAPSIFDAGPMGRVVFSRDGAWAAMTGTEKLHVVGRSGGTPRFLEPFPSGTGSVAAAFDPGSEHLYAAKDGRVKVWSVPGFELLETQDLGGSLTRLRSTRAGVLAGTLLSGARREIEIVALAAGAPPRPVVRIEGVVDWDVDDAGRSLLFAKGGTFHLRTLSGDGALRAREVGRYDGRPWVRFHAAGDRIVAYDDASGRIRLWAADAVTRAPIRSWAASQEPGAQLNQESERTFPFDVAARRLAAIGSTPNELRIDLWALDAPVAAAARSFPTPFGGFLYESAFAPDGRWLATANFHASCFWPLPQTEPRVLLGHGDGVIDVEFTRDGRRLVSADRTGEVREWELAPGGADRTLAQVHNWSTLAVDPRGRYVAVAQPGGVRIVPLGPYPARSLEGFAPATAVMDVAVDTEGRRVAAASLSGPAQDKVIRVWDLETGEVWTLGPTEQAGEGLAGQTTGLGFLPDGSLASTGDGGLRVWSLASGDHQVIAPSFVQSRLAVFPGGRAVLHIVSRGEGRIDAVSAAISDLVTRSTRIVHTHGDRLMPIAVDPSGRFIATGGLDGIVRVGPASGAEPHLLVGHQGWIHAVAFSPDGRWIASGGDDRTVRLWPMPDLAEPPLHTLPLDRLLTELRSLTNVRVVKDSESTISAWLQTKRGSGYELDLEPFPGWAKAPER